MLTGFNGLPVVTEMRITTGSTASNVSTIYGLNAGDDVRVRFVASIGGAIQQYLESTHFAAATFPSVTPVP